MVITHTGGWKIAEQQTRTKQLDSAGSKTLCIKKLSLDTTRVTGSDSDCRSAKGNPQTACGNSLKGKKRRRKKKRRKREEGTQQTNADNFR